jgi:hypothetical protein
LPAGKANTSISWKERFARSGKAHSEYVKVAKSSSPGRVWRLFPQLKCASSAKRKKKKLPKGGKSRDATSARFFYKFIKWAGISR